MKRILALAPLVLAACGPSSEPSAKPDAAPSVVVADAWCRATPNAARAGGCFATFQSTTDDRLTGGSTPRAAQLQVHEMSMDGGMMKMGQIEGGLPLPADESIALAPGGNHIMLMELTQPLVEGETVPLTLQFGSAPAVTVQAPVRRVTPGGGQHH
jgi:copper(I)-binding protein